VSQVHTGRQPFHHLSSEFAVFMDVSAGRRPARPAPKECLGGLGIPDALWSLIQRCWAQDPAHRPTAAEVLEYFKESEDGSDDATSEQWHLASPTIADSGDSVFEKAQKSMKEGHNEFLDLTPEAAREMLDKIHAVHKDDFFSF
jgi:hypothetical protein